MASLLITLVAVVVIVGVLGSLVTSGNVHAAALVDGGVVRIEPVGIAKMWSFTGKREVPVVSITSVTTADDVRALNIGWRYGGSAFPGVLLAGKFWSKANGRAWLCVGKGRPVVVIAAEGLRFRRFIFSADDPAAVVKNLR